MEHLSFWFGVLGAAAVFALLALGFWGGWMSHAAFRRYTAPNPAPPGEQERRALAQQQRAFHLLQNYSAERAYGLLEGGGEEI